MLMHKIQSTETIHSCLTIPDGMFSLSTTLTWQEFEPRQQIISLKKNKLAWTALITIRSKNAMRLQELNLQWYGESIDKVHASLYRKGRTNQELIPIQEYLICDGIWNTKKQQIMFILDEKVVAINQYYLVLSFPNQAVKKLKHGHFTLTKTNPLKMVSL